MNDILSIIRSAGAAAPSADNSQPWQLNWDGEGESIAIRYPAQRLAASNTFGPSEPPTLLAIGAVIENLVQAAAAYEVAATWHLAEGTDADSYGHLSLAGARQGEADPARVAHILARHTNRNPYRSRPVDATILEALPERQGAARTLIVTEPTSKARIADLLRQSGELRFQTPELFGMLADSLRFTEAEADRGDGLDVRTLALPPGGSLFLKAASKPAILRAFNRVKLYKVLARIDALPVARATALVCLAGPSDRASLIDAGRLMERIWIELNAAGVAVHPYYALTDQLNRLAANRVAEHLLPQARNIADQVPEAFGIGPDELPQIILRIGYPVRAARRSRRLPLAAVCEETGLS